MPRGEHLAELNRKRAEDRANEKAVEATLAAQATPAPVELGPTELVDRDPQPDAPYTDPEMERLRRHNAELVAELQALKTLRAQAPMAGAIFPTAAPRISKPLPPNYGVWLGPEPPDGVQFCLSAKGRVACIPKREPVEMVDGDGLGKRRTVVGTTHGGTTSSYIDNGFTAIEFNDRCPPNHKYAGRLYARIDCPEHAAWLQLTAGRDREKHQLFVWYLVTPFRTMYEQLKRSHMRRKELETVEVEDVMSHGQEMPVDVAAV